MCVRCREIRCCAGAAVSASLPPGELLGAKRRYLTFGRSAADRSLGKATRGKYFKRYQQGSNAVVIDPDLAEAFPSSKAVNDALREVLSRRGRKSTSVK